MPKIVVEVAEIPPGEVTQTLWYDNGETLVEIESHTHNMESHDITVFDDSTLYVCTECPYNELREVET